LKQCVTSITKGIQVPTGSCITAHHLRDNHTQSSLVTVKKKDLA